MKIRKYLIALLVIVTFMTIVRICVSPLMITTWWMRIVEFCFYLSPALLAWAVERRNLKEFCQDYLFHYKDVNWRMTLRWVLLTTVSYPLLIGLLVFIGGNLLGFDAMGRVIRVSEDFVYMGISFDGGSLWGNVSLLLVNILLALCYGVTLGALAHIAEEVGWRGFLEKHLCCKPAVKPLIAGFIWTLWGLPFYNNGAYYWLVLLAFNIALSFYLSGAVRQSNTIWTAAAIRGVVSTCNLSAIEPANSGIVQLGVALCVVAGMLVASRLVKIKQSII